IAHIGVIKTLANAGIKPEVIAGVSAGSIVGAGLAAGMDWRDLLAMARSILFWPSLLHGGRLESFCARNLPETFSRLTIPFAAVATAIPKRRVVTITAGHLPSAISASCSIPHLRRPVEREGQKLVDGGVACVMPSIICRELGAEFVIASDVWEYSSLLRAFGCHPSHPNSTRIYPQHYLLAVHHTDLLIHSAIPLRGYIPGKVECLIAAGEEAARRALAQLSA
ncbi:MAG: patatin-like phospholipase family protein, partial [Blastocatellia bacterium]|nr:patatin-like phospholipase family protein [Blastocatellia bacterium]